MNHTTKVHSCFPDGREKRLMKGAIVTNLGVQFIVIKNGEGPNVQVCLEQEDSTRTTAFSQNDTFSHWATLAELRKYKIEIDDGMWPPEGDRKPLKIELIAKKYFDPPVREVLRWEGDMPVIMALFSSGGPTGVEISPSLEEWKPYLPSKEKEDKKPLLPSIDPRSVEPVKRHVRVIGPPGAYWTTVGRIYEGTEDLGGYIRITGDKGDKINIFPYDGNFPKNTHALPIFTYVDKNEEVYVKVTGPADAVHVTVGKIYKVIDWHVYGGPRINRDDGAPWNLFDKEIEAYRPSWELSTKKEFEEQNSKKKYIPEIGDVFQVHVPNFSIPYFAIAVEVNPNFDIPKAWILTDMEGKKRNVMDRWNGWPTHMVFVRKATPEERKICGLDKPDQDELRRKLNERIGSLVVDNSNKQTILLISFTDEHTYWGRDKTGKMVYGNINNLRIEKGIRWPTHMEKDQYGIARF